MIPIDLADFVTPENTAESEPIEEGTSNHPDDQIQELADLEDSSDRTEVGNYGIKLDWDPIAQEASTEGEENSVTDLTANLVTDKATINPVPKALTSEFSEESTEEGAEILLADDFESEGIVDPVVDDSAAEAIAEDVEDSTDDSTDIDELEEPLDLAEEPIDETPEEIPDETEEAITETETPEEVTEPEITDETEEPLDLAEEPIDETPEEISDETEDTDEPEEPLDLAESLPTESEVLGGFFTVGNDSVVAIDWLYDGGGYSHGQMGIFSLDGLDINSPEFTTLALQRAMSNSGFGYMVINDAIEGAKFASPENAGTYAGLKIMSLQAGGTYAIVLIPNGTFEAALTQLTSGEELSRQLQPIFSLTTTNPSDQFSSGLLIDVTGDGNTFIMEDLSSKGYSDLDFNDIIFQVRGMNGIAVSLDELFDYAIVDLAKDWRTSDTGQAIMEYLLPYVADLEQLPLPEMVEIPTANQPLIGVIDTGFANNNPYLDYTKITWGSDFIDQDSDPTWQAGEIPIQGSGGSIVTLAGNEHGTHVLGEIMELNPNAPVHAIRAVGSGKWAEALVEFVNTAQASNQPQAVVNLSMDLTTTTSDGITYNRYELTAQERDAIAYAQSNNVLLVVSSGNSGMDEGQMYSAWGAAAQEFDNILVVGAASPMPSVEDAGEISTGTTASTWNRSDFSNYNVGIVAEGGTLANPELSTVGDGLGVMAGTSVATAKVTAAVSQVWAANPQLNYRQVVEILQATATDVNALGWDQETGAGLLNVAAAVQLAKVTAGEVLVPRVAVPVVPNQAPVDDSAVATERPANTATFGSPSRVPFNPMALLRSAAPVVKAAGLAALNTLIAVGGTVVSAPVAIAAIGVTSVVALGLVGKAYYDLEQAKAEAAANTAADVWCVTNPQECHAGDTTGHFVIQGLYDNGTPYYHHVPVGAAFSIAVRPSLYGNYYVVFHSSSATGISIGLGRANGSFTPRVFWAPNPGYAASPTWAQLSAGAQQEIFISGALSEYLLNAARSGPSGFLSGGSLASQGITGLTVFGANNTAATFTGSVGGYPKNSIWTFQSGLGWVAQIPGLAQVYFPNNIPAATKRRNGPPTWRVGADGIGQWVFRSEDTIHLGDGIEVDSEVYHRQIKPKILTKAGKFQGRVGKNPDIEVINGEIVLKGSSKGPFRGKSMKTGLKASDFIDKDGNPVKQ